MFTTTQNRNLHFSCPCSKFPGLWWRCWETTREEVIHCLRDKVASGPSFYLTLKRWCPFLHHSLGQSQQTAHSPNKTPPSQSLSVLFCFFEVFAYNQYKAPSRSGFTPGRNAVFIVLDFWVSAIAQRNSESLHPELKSRFHRGQIALPYK